MKARLSFAMRSWFCFFLCLIMAASRALASEEPRVQISRAQADFILSWPVTAADWMLEQSAQLLPASAWTQVPPDLYQTNATQRFLRISGLGETRYFRLRALRPPVPGLTGYWQMDEGQGQVVDGGNGAALFLSNTAWASGRFGPGALRFNGGPATLGGSRAWVSNTNYQVLPPAGRAFSLSLWFNPEALTTGWRGLVGNDVNGTNGWHVALEGAGPGTNVLVFTAPSSGTSRSVTGRTLLLPGQWYELTVTHDGSEASLYLDSILLAHGPAQMVDQAGPIFLGGGVGNRDSFLGRMDDLRTYTNCLTQEQISLTGHWRFNEGGGSFVGDSSLQGHHGGLTDPAAWATGREGSGVDLSFAQVRIGNDSDAVLPPTGHPFSVSFWLLPRSAPSGRSGLMIAGAGTNGGWELALETESSGRSLLEFVSTNHGGTLNLVAPVGLTNGAWTKVDLTYNGGIAVLYLNGRKVKDDNGAIRSSSGPLVIGAVVDGTEFNGVIDELKVYRRERDASEIGPLAHTLWETVLLNRTTNLTLQGFGPPGKTLTYSILPLLPLTNSTLMSSPDSSIVTVQAGGRKGPDAFAYTVSDGEFTSAPAVVTLSVVEPHWLSPAGGAGGPGDGRSPAGAWVAGAVDALDAIWRTNNYYDCFFYAPGEYQTRGYRFGERSTANPGCKHVGSGTEGADQTTIRLVDVWDALGEGTIFATRLNYETCDNFEVHRLVLDCNAANLPKYTRGEPVWIRIPLAHPTIVEAVTLWWADTSLPGLTFSRLGSAAELSLRALRSSTNTFLTNWTSVVGQRPMDVVTVGAEADELFLQFDRRASGVNHYGLAEIEVAGAAVSLPVASIAGGGDSRLDLAHPILLAVDENPASAWISGPEPQVEITLPLAADTAISQVNLHWKCRTLGPLGRTGPASDYRILARDPKTGSLYEVPFVRRGLTATQAEANTFGTVESTNVIVTDQLVLQLQAREGGADFYSLSEVTLQNGSLPVKMRLPAASSLLGGGPTYSIFQAFDQDPDSVWASGTQGMVTAISVTGSNLKFTHLKVRGFGTKAGKECYPLFSYAPGVDATPRRLGNVLVEDCYFGEPATENTDGMTTVVLYGNSPDTLTNAVIRRCTLEGLRPYFPVYSQGFVAVQVENCRVENVQKAVYYEPDGSDARGSDPILIRSNQFINVDLGLFLLSHAGAQFDTITFLRNEIVLTGPSGWGVGACDICDPGRSGSLTNFTILDNIIRYADWAPHPERLDGGLLYSDLHHAVFGNNLIVLGTANDLRVRLCPGGRLLPPEPSDECSAPLVPPPVNTPAYPPCVDVALPGYRRAWFNNRNLEGALLPVRFNNFGVDGLASQQQWPD